MSGNPDHLEALLYEPGMSEEDCADVRMVVKRACELGELTNREAAILALRYRLGMTLAECAAALSWDVTTERVREVEQRALRKLRGALCTKLNHHREDFA